MTLINCSNCRTPLQLPTGAGSIRCSICRAVTVVADPRGFPPPPSPTHHNYFPFHHHHNHHHHHPSPPPTQSHYHSPPPPMYPGPAGGGRSSKRAVICGISYKNTPRELQGCINDAKCMKYLLVNRFNFPDSSILMLTDEETDIYKIPTKQNIRMAMHWLVQGVQPGDSLVFHFSGHGLQQRNYTGDEIDGFDESLCPLDFETAGTIIDDEINATIVRPLPYGAKLHAIIDSCHSGTMLDLPFLCRMHKSGSYTWEDHRPPSGVYKGTNGGEVISFSGCDDDQTAADTQAMSKVTTTGAMTFSFIKAIESGEATTYGGSFFGRLGQEPQLTAHSTFDVYSKPFSL
ncbi:metacaspase-1-like isoform X2 [Cucumis melo]|uniref:Metacaspase-1-like isoform X2 n=1 Tax=Cucumis melo TaxID=3656 RepID=A0A1S3BX77_CUCME|nr:metacaspase-1-like isoform X2 [Cucumis melo]